mmetsp:Transcript_33392/g.56783  ORF Transcript_33392/g.56783 Transcript_33392/m.56783 type:complete len:256 (-) Transcript_33392:162-929(-)|eukprot:CAMPEP_0183758472 /NCGR_PEP_ID=MMETSP0739-20130205/6450_1 /TAXON_ID=385413 /ORGANISM="Thalassiosira miniscula, Strain CCMP1093" /LENGTH=255 /DNA_ID=CAMNT_0025996093 /DNA_START=28 /DNA_END=795 /DNA_ORIENTATION=-
MNNLTRNLLLIGAIINSIYTDAYRIGDAVGILLRTHTPSNGSATLEAYRHQLPRFGVSTKTRFDTSSLLNADDIRLSEQGITNNNNKPQRRKINKMVNDAGAAPSEHLRLSLSFDEGFHHIPWLDVYNPSQYNEKVLQNLIITIVYSGSDGSIHAVHRETKYANKDNNKKNVGKDGMPKSFTVEYIWVNEADVDVQGGLLALFVAVLVVSLSGMLGACISSGDDSGSRSGKGKYKEKHSSESLAVGTSGGYTKSL